MKKTIKLITYLYLSIFIMVIVPHTLYAQKLSDVIIIKGAYIDRLNDAQVGDTINIKLSDGRIFTQPLKISASMQAENEWSVVYDLPTIKGTLIINKQGTDIRGYIRLEETDYIYILDSFNNGDYKFLLKSRNDLIEE